MKENEILGNEERAKFLINNSNNEKEKEKEKFPSKPIITNEDKKTYNINDFNTNINDDDSNTLLSNNNNNNSNNNIPKMPNRIFGLRLHLNLNKCFQALKMTKMGKSFAFFYDKNDDPLIIIGPQWPFCLLLLFLSIFAFIFIYIYYNDKSTTLVKISDWIFFGTWIVSYILMCMKNPGYPKMCSESIRGTKEMSYCDKCEVWYKPSSSTIHCEICDICIEGYTHHCFWAGHCIEGNNKKDFYIFLIVSIIFPIYLIINIAAIGKH